MQQTQSDPDGHAISCRTDGSSEGSCVKEAQAPLGKATVYNEDNYAYHQNLEASINDDSNYINDPKTPPTLRNKFIAYRTLLQALYAGSLDESGGAASIFIKDHLRLLSDLGASPDRIALAEKIAFAEKSGIAGVAFAVGFIDQYNTDRDTGDGTGAAVLDSTARSVVTVGTDEALNEELCNGLVDDETIGIGAIGCYLGASLVSQGVGKTLHQLPYLVLGAGQEPAPGTLYQYSGFCDTD